MDLTKRRVLVTGGKGFIGQHVVRVLEDRGCIAISAPSSREFDLREKHKVRELFHQVNPEVVINLAARLGGIEEHVRDSSRIMHDNLLIGLNVTNEAMLTGTLKFVNIGTSCSYPAVCPSPIKETSLWQGFPNSATAPYGVAKAAITLLTEVYCRERGFPTVTVIPANVYGPHDMFDLHKSHVIPALIMKALEAKETNSKMMVWGTGRATREFIYVDDVAEAIVRAAEDLQQPEPINIGTGVETPMWTLASAIRELIDPNITLEFDTTKPEGAQGRVFDVSKAKELLGFEAHTPIQQGLEKTIEWYKNEIAHQGKR